MPHYKVNMMGGFRVADLELVLDEGSVYEFSDDDVRRSKGLTAARRDRWMVETDAAGKPLKKASKPRRTASSASEIAILDADDEDEEEKLGQVLDDELENHFDDEFADAVANDKVATPFGDKGGGTKRKSGRKRKAGKSVAK